jgi:hypothetical protein
MPLSDPPVRDQYPVQTGISLKKGLVYLAIAVGAFLALYAVIHFAGERKDPPQGPRASASVTVSVTNPVNCGKMRYKDCAKVPVAKASAWSDIKERPILNCEDKATAVTEGDRLVAVNVCDCKCEE